MSRTTSGKPAPFPPDGGKAPIFGQMAKAVAAALTGALLTACSPAPQELSFAARSADPVARKDGQVMPFANGEVMLAAPAGYCFDRRSSLPQAGGGFALIAHCSRLEGRGWFGARKAAVLTASIGPARQNALAPRASDIAAMFPGARLLESREDQLLPLVRLEFPQAVAKGASPVHWRGAFVLDRHLIALALYAPDGSSALGSHGAALLNEAAHRTLEASTLPALEQAEAAQDPAADAARKKRGLSQRIAGLFQ